MSAAPVAGQQAPEPMRRCGCCGGVARYPDLASTGLAFPCAPVLESGWVVIAQPFAVTYCITAAWNGTDDLSSS